VALAAAPAGARSGALQQNRDKAEAIAAEISTLDAQIGSAVTRYSRATRGLEAVRHQLKANRRLQRLAYKELGLARASLSARSISRCAIPWRRAERRTSRRAISPRCGWLAGAATITCTVPTSWPSLNAANSIRRPCSTSPTAWASW
jgi:hypothetical protein